MWSTRELYNFSSRGGNCSPLTPLKNLIDTRKMEPLFECFALPDTKGGKKKNPIPYLKENCFDTKRIGKDFQENCRS